MSKKPERPAGGRIQCHFVSNTHWDREWMYSAQRTRHMLVYMMDLLLDIFAREPAYGPFHLDSQTLPIRDYLEIRPEREEEIRRHVKAGRLHVGPWYCLPDEFCVGGESLIRNLLLGHRIAQRFGRVSKSGYSPFSWGQISQMPQIYRGFGIDVMTFYRGVNTLVAPRSEFVWEGPDGTDIVVSRLAPRPRYNAWYILQRPAYWGAKLDALNDFEIPWDAGHAPFRMVDEAHAALDYKLAHQRHDYDASVVPAAARQALEEQDNDWSALHRLWSCGHDSSCPDLRELRMIADASRALRDCADVFPSSMESFENEIRRTRSPHWPRVTGEMRHTYTKGSSSMLLGWILSARTWIKQDNFRTERELTRYAEPATAFATFLGTPYPRPFLDAAYEWLLQNHAHDSIGGCACDAVSDDMRYRFRQAREIATCVLEQAMVSIAGSISFDRAASDDLGLLLFNATPRKRTEVVSITLDIPGNWNPADFEIFDEKGGTVPYQIVGTESPYQERVHNPNDVFCFVTAHRHNLRLETPSVPGMGYRSLHVRRAKSPGAPARGSLRTGPRRMENEHVRVRLNANGTIDVHHIETGRTFRGLGYLRDSGAAGNPWQHEAPPLDSLFTTLKEKAEIDLLHDGALECAMRVRIPWRTPASLSEDRRERASQLVPFPVEHTVTLRKGKPWVEITTRLDNTAKDHYLRVSFPTRLAANHVDVQSQFDVVRRPIERPSATQFDDEVQAEQPMNSFVDISDGNAGLAILNDGLKAYEAHDDPARTLSLTLLRALRMRFFVPEKFDHPGHSDGSQCPGLHVFRYAILPHAGDWATARVWQAAEEFTTPLLAAQVGITKHGCEPRSRSFLEVRPERLHVSAVKQSENGRGWIVRLFNPYDKTVRGRVRLNGGLGPAQVVQSPVERVRAEFAPPRGRRRPWKRAREVTLEERPVRDATPDADGWVPVAIMRKRILTLEFLP